MLKRLMATEQALGVCVPRDRPCSWSQIERLMLVVQKKRRVPLALMSLAGTVTALGAMSLLSRHTVAPGCPPLGNGLRVTPSVSEKTVEVSLSPTLASRAPAQKEGKRAARVSTSVSIRLGDLIIPVVDVQPRELRDTFRFTFGRTDEFSMQILDEYTGCSTALRLFSQKR